jgi:hypothetical protein
MKRQIKFFLVFISLIMTLSVVYHLNSRVVSNVYQISIPYNGYSKTTYYTEFYTEKNGCVEFIDDWNQKIKLCGIYQITKQ